MRILHLDSGREMRGGQWQVLRLHQGLVEAGHDSLLLARAEAPLLRMARDRELPCRPLNWPLVAYLSRRYDVVHVHDARSHTFAMLLSSTPLIVSRRVAFPVKKSAVSRWKYSRPALYLAVSAFVAGQLREAGVPGERILIVHDGIPAPAEVPPGGDAFLVPFSLDPRKGMALAEQAAAIAGIPLRQSKNLEADLPHARGLVYLSYSEGLGSGILLAMAHAVPVIASNVGGIPELITDGVNGILVPNDAAAIARAFFRLNRQMGLAARQTVLNRFTEQHMVQATLAAYRQALNA